MKKLFTTFAALVLSITAYAQSPVFSAPSGSANLSTTSPQAFNGPIQVPSLISLVQPVYNVLGYGAVGNGVHDDTAGIAAAATACATTGGILYFPQTGNAFTTTASINPPANCSVEVDGTVRATAVISAVFNIGATGQARHKIFFGSGTVDSGNLAQRHIWLTSWDWYEITGVRMFNGASIAGIDIGTTGTTYGGAVIHDLTLYVPSGVSSIPGNVGIWADTGTDSIIGPNIQIVGFDTGAKDSVGGGQAWKSIHVWGNGPSGGWVGSNIPTTCFVSNGDSVWIDDECDTPSSIGFHGLGFNDHIDHYRCYNNSTWGTNNVVNCIQFDQTNPTASIMNSRFKGQTSSNRLAADVVAPGNNFSTITMLGNQVMGNVVITNSLNSAVTVPSGSTFSVIGGTAQMNNGIRIGFSGTFINFMWKGSGTLTYTSITAPGCQEQPLTIANAVSGDVCHASTGATDIGSGFSYAGCRVSAANTAQIKVCATATGTPTATTWTGWATH